MNNIVRLGEKRLARNAAARPLSQFCLCPACEDVVEAIEMVDANYSRFACDNGHDRIEWEQRPQDAA